MPHADREVRLAYHRAKHALNRETANARRKADYFENHEKEKAARRAWYAANRDKALAIERARQYRLRYGITPADYDVMLAAQGGGCAICGATQPSQKKSKGVRYYHTNFAVDHCHDSGRIRGLLCVSCNVSLGMAERWYSKYKDKIHGYLGRNL